MDEKRIDELEKRVAALEVQAQEQLELNLTFDKKVNLKEVVQSIIEASRDNNPKIQRRNSY